MTMTRDVEEENFSLCPLCPLLPYTEVPLSILLQGFKSVASAPVSHLLSSPPLNMTQYRDISPLVTYSMTDGSTDGHSLVALSKLANGIQFASKAIDFSRT